MWALISVLWLAYAGACLWWVRPLFWTTLPIGVLLSVRGEGHRWRVVATFVLPLAVATLLAQGAMSWLDEPASLIGLALWTAAAVWFSVTVIPTPVRDAWIARLPPSFVDEPFVTRLAGARLQRSTEAANRLLGEVEAGRDLSRCARTARVLAATARRERQRDGTWQDAWTTHAAWLEALAERLGAGWSDAGAREVNELEVAANDALRAAVERAKVIDPASVTPPSSGA